MKTLFWLQGRKYQYYGVINNTFFILFVLTLVFPALLFYKYL